LIFDFPQRFIY